ncbi:MAG: ribosome biogenesis GTPase Der [Dissulfurispiraceae bacterium]|jgi:GTP-binding protein|nr:ribosome biogenesis GTPase Der [Dissulfurispiraceae bacterium]
MEPVVAIVGRPNSGKSTLFNRMTRKSGRSAITQDTPGVTRDRNYGRTEWEGRYFTVIDTGGLYGESAPLLSEGFEKGVKGRKFSGQTIQSIVDQVKEQVMIALDEADIIIHLLDVKEGLAPSDMELARMLIASGKTVVTAINKVDNPKNELMAAEFYETGASSIMTVSSATGLGYEELMDHLVSLMPESAVGIQPADESLIPKIAVVGKPNVGKSTLINALLSKNRLIVSPVPGTTRDSIDSICTYYKKSYIFIDTAGIRKKNRENAIEWYSVVRAMKSIERCDVAVIMIDAAEGITDQDQKIAGMVHDYGKSALLLYNKWDLVEEPEEAYKKIEAEIDRKIWFMNHAPVLTTSGLQRKRITKIFPIISELIAERQKRIPTSQLNKVFGKAFEGRSMPTYRGREIKLKYITQVGVMPPEFTLFANYPQAIKEQHIRYIEKMLREEFSFKGAPIRIHVKSR